jgi:2,3-bisphosphoglycerate-independent phosphoglycerate mutase
VATYDLQPEMSVYWVSKRLVDEINKDKYHLIITNFVNGDMVGHTWIFDAIEQSVEAVDAALQKTIDAALHNDYVVLILADHGNAEDQSPEWRTSHTLNPVPFIVVAKWLESISLKEWKWLKDIAPTILALMGIDKPLEMTGESIIEERK